MTKARKDQISLSDTQYYHCTSRCVRRAFLCGDDPVTKQNFDHRRDIIEQRILELSTVYAIDILSYAIMSNHLHLVLKISPEKQEKWTDEEVVTHWHSIHFGHEITRKYLKNGKVSDDERALFNQVIAIYRERLGSLSWFMRDLNEYIARLANTEDNCKGHFWEGRYSSQALLDEKALITCMAYVDLNPIRAQEANSLENSNFTSIKRRIAWANLKKQPFKLLPFIGLKAAENSHGIRFNLIDYLLLVEESGKQLREDKKGHLDPKSNILRTLNLDHNVWFDMMKNFENNFGDRAGSKEELQRYYFAHHFKRRPNVSNSLL